MTITAKIIADSISPQGIRLTTMQLRYPRFIHAEFMTHRVFSRNASSSRAVPVERLILDVKRDPVFPSFWGKNQSGMQAREELDPTAAARAGEAWGDALRLALRSALALHALGAHKQSVNRLLEPFSHVNVVVTSTEWANFFALRRHPDAQPEIRELAEAMANARDASEPQGLFPGQWHLPYVETRIEEDGLRGTGTCPIAIRVSVARCARVSYLTHEGKTPTIEEDLALYDRLVSSVPLHASPAEHQATPDREAPRAGFGYPCEWAHPDRHGNFEGFVQYRKILLGEYTRDR